MNTSKDLDPFLFLNNKYTFTFNREQILKNFESFCNIKIASVGVKLFEYEYSLAINHKIVSNLEEFKLLKESDEYLQTYIFIKYPYYKIHIDKIFESLVKNFENILVDLDNDTKELLQSKFINCTELVKIDFGLGDFHSNLKATCILQFEDGCKLLYKPRKVNTEIFFNNFIKTLENILDLSINVKIPEFILKDNYSWHKFIEYSFSEKKHNYDKYFDNIAFLLTMGYILNSRDFIYDNIIIYEDKLYLIDIECLLSTNIEKKSIFQSQIDKKLNNSVLNCGVLPIPYDSYNKNRSISALFANENLDNFHLPQKNLLPLEIDIKGATIIGEAFENYMIIIFEKREKILKSLENYSSDINLRLLYHSTDLYSNLINELIIPEYLQDISGFKSLIMSSFVGETKNFKTSILNQLINLDIPFYYSNTNEEIIDGTGKFLKKSKKSSFDYAIKLTYKKLIALDLDHISLNKKLIIDSIKIELDKKHKIFEDNFIFIKNKENVINLNKMQLLKASENVACQLIDESYSSNGEVTWITKTLNSADSSYQLNTLGPDLYDGDAGLEIFFKMLGRYSRNKELKKISNIIKNKNNKLYDKALTSESIILKDFDLSTFIFPASNLLGTMYNIEGNNSALLESQLGKIFNLINNNISEVKNWDYLQGTSSLLDKLLDIKSSNLKLNVLIIQELNLAINLLINNLLDNITNLKEGVAWNFIMDINGTNYDNYLTGFSHGVSGIMFVLTKAKVILNDSRLDIIIRKAHQFEKSLFINNGWLDNRLGDRLNDMNSWCHGSGGVALSKLLLLNYTNSKEYEAELRVATENISNLEKLNHGLCHGSMGNLEILAASDNYFKENRYTNLINNFLEDLSSNIIEGKIPRVSENGAINLTGMFVGKTGVGYQLMRFYDWEKVPSIICLETPLHYYKTMH